ncbi:MAG: ROK family protein [Pedobacter sp.]|nr:MAG: ROK family protein [Pedobacter sp.]
MNITLNNPLGNLNILGVDIGGTHISAAIIDVQTKLPIAKTFRRRLVDSNGTADAILNSWSEVIKESCADLGRIGIAMPGPFDYEGGISLIQDQDKFRALYKINIKDEIAIRLGISKSAISFINDAAGFLQGEIFAGTVGDAKSVFGITLGTGLGSSFATSGVATDAALWDFPFLEGIAEDYLSSRWFLKRYAELTTNTVSGVRELAELAESDSDARLVFEEFGDNFATFTIPFIKKHQFDAIVVGGNIAQASRFFLLAMETKFEREQVKIQVVMAKLKEHAALIGAASCCLANKEI